MDKPIVIQLSKDEAIVTAAVLKAFGSLLERSKSSSLLAKIAATDLVTIHKVEQIIKGKIAHG